MTRKYFVSVFMGGKCASLFWSNDLCEIHVCRLLFRGCEIEVFDVEEMSFVPSSYVRQCEHLAKDMIRADMMPRHVVCVETKEIYKSMSACADAIGVTAATVASHIFDLSDINGLHYILESDIKESEIL